MPIGIGVCVSVSNLEVVLVAVEYITCTQTFTLNTAMMLARPPDDPSTAVLAAPADDKQGDDPKAPDPPHGPAPAALQSHSISTPVDLRSVFHDRTMPVVPTRLGLDSSPALFLWESRTTNVDVMCVSNTTRPSTISR